MSTKKELPRLLSAALLLCLPLAACHHDDHDHVDEDPNVEACEHMEQGPPVAITALAAPGDKTPKISNDHQRYDVTLVDVAGAKGGSVSFESRGGGYIFYTSAGVTLAVTNASGATVAATSSFASVPQCTAVKGRHTYEMPIGSYAIGVVPGAVDKVSFVVEQEHRH